jgi:hypothetical protein
VPPAVLCAFDVAVTLAGQESAYWLGNYDAAHEANPLARSLLVLHPGLFLGAALAWLFAFVGLLLALHRRLVVLTSFLLTLGHATGAATWLIQGGAAGWLCTVAAFVAAERLIAWSWARAGVDRRHRA